MTRVQKNTKIEASQDLAFDVIYDLEKYHTFIPWCKKAGYIDGIDTNDETRTAFIELALGPIKYRLTTINQAVRPESIDLSLSSGPLKSLRGIWKVAHLSENSCEMSIDISFEWGSGMLGKSAEKAFEFICQQLADIFKKRAENLTRQNAK